MRYLSLFSGIEAFSVAVHDFGWTPLAFAEIARHPSRVLAERFPDVPNLGDITAVDWSVYAPDRCGHFQLGNDGRCGLYCLGGGGYCQRDGAEGARCPRDGRNEFRVDILVAGSPCQAFSVAGKRHGLEDARGNLTLFTGELVRYLAPRFFIWENVPGVFSDKSNAFGQFLALLVGCDTAIEPTGGKWTDAGMVDGPEGRLAWRVLDARYFGVAQRRRRIFLVRCPATGGDDPAQVLFERAGDGGHFTPRKRSREGLADRIGLESAMARLLGSGMHDAPVRGAGVPYAVGPSGGAHADVAPTIDIRSRNGAMQNQVGAIVLQDTTARDKGQNGLGVGEGTAYTLDTLGQQGVLCMAPAFSKRPGQQIACRDDESFAVTTGEPPRVLAYRKSARAQASPDAGGFETWVDDGIANTLNAFDVGERDTHAVVSPYGEVRRLTPDEAARLQGFPDGWARVGPADGPQYAGYGNSMAVPVMRWIAARTDSVANGKPYRYGIPAEARAEIEGRDAPSNAALCATDPIPGTTRSINE